MSESASRLINSYVAIPETAAQTTLFQSVQAELTSRIGTNTNNITTHTTDQEFNTNDANSVAHQDITSHSSGIPTVPGNPNNDALGDQHDITTHRLGNTRQQRNSNNADTPSADDHNEEQTTIEQENYINNKHVGPKIDSAKEDHIFRVYFCNINGLKLGNDGGDYAEFCLEMEKLQTDTWGIAETNLDSCQHCVRDIVHKTTRKHFEYGKLSIGSSMVPARKSHYKPGGTLMCSQGKATSRIIDQGNDRYGRWSYQTLICKNYKKLVIIMAYQVCHQNLTTTDEDGNLKVKSYTCSAQQTSMLRQRGRRETPREAFVMDLQAFILEQQEQQASILLLGDFNEVLGNTGEQVSSIATDCGLVDLMEQATDTTDTATYVRGKDRIDYALASESVSEALKQGCYEPFKYRTRGDHHSIIWTLTNTSFSVMRRILSQL